MQYEIDIAHAPAPAALVQPLQVAPTKALLFAAALEIVLHKRKLFPEFCVLDI